MASLGKFLASSLTENFSGSRIGLGRLSSKVEERLDFEKESKEGKARPVDGSEIPKRHTVVFQPAFGSCALQTLVEICF